MAETPRPLVAYYRVSTAQQGASGLGLEGQVAAVEQYARDRGAAILARLPRGRERQAGRPPRAGQAPSPTPAAPAPPWSSPSSTAWPATSHFLAGLMEAGVDFVACDNPHANRLTIHILAAVAEDEARRISERTRAALAAYKARGGKLGAARPGAPRLTAEARARGARRRRPGRPRPGRRRLRRPGRRCWPSCGPAACRCGRSPPGSTPRGTPPDAGGRGTRCRWHASSAGPDRPDHDRRPGHPRERLAHPDRPTRSGRLTGGLCPRPSGTGSAYLPSLDTVFLQSLVTSAGVTCRAGKKNREEGDERCKKWPAGSLSRLKARTGRDDAPADGLTGTVAV